LAGNVANGSSREDDTVPTPAHPRFRRSILRAKLAEYLDSGDLTVNLTLRELRSRYKKSFFGWAWSLLNPLSTVIVYSIVFSFFLKIQPPTGDPSGLHNFAAFLLCGLLPWNYLQGGMTGSMGSLIGNSNLIKKVYFPREVFVVSTIGSLLVSFLIELGVLAAILLLMGNMVLPWIPVVLLIVAIQSFFVLGVGFLLSVLNVYFRDVQHLVSIALMALFYSAPIVYPISVVPKTAHIGGAEVPLRAIYNLNPLVQLIGCYRAAMYDLRFPPVLSLLYLVAWSIVLVGIGLWVFQKLDHRLAEEV
jgi:ABC-type polysaccharide/polyol phosphate export permease